MPANHQYYVPADMKTQAAWGMADLHCCGAVQWSLGGSVDAAKAETDLKIIADYWKNSRSVASLILKEGQRLSIEPILLKFGFQKTWGPVPNLNTRNNLYGYMLDLNVYRTKTLEEAKKATKK